jgi:hypothetical protein
MLSKARGRAELSAIKVEKTALISLYRVASSSRAPERVPGQNCFRLDSRGTRQHEISASVAVGRECRNVRGRHSAFHAPDRCFRLR